jgi:iron complex transport system substrate-binding protein
MEKPATRIISLYSAHTENLFTLGLENEIIGVGKSESFPHTALEKEVFDYRADPEKIIAAQPDLVIIRPFIERKNPNFVNALKRSGLTVVSLYPDNYEEFDEYIVKLGKVTGREKKAEQQLDIFNSELKDIENMTKNIKNKVGVYFESSDREYKTVTEGSFADRAIALAGGRNIADDAVAIEKGSTIAVYGLERIIERGSEIDVFVTQRGVMGAGGNTHSISIRPGFNSVKAVKEGRILELNQKIISSPTFRQVTGIKEMMRFFYPDEFNDYSEFDKDELLTRSDFAKLSVLYRKKQIFAPTSSYFRSEYRGHKYGEFADVYEADDNYNFIETAAISGYISGDKIENEEFFYPEEMLTREDLAMFVNLIVECSGRDEQKTINDMDDIKNKKVIQNLIDNNVLSLENGNFNPNKTLTGKEVLEVLESL